MKNIKAMNNTVKMLTGIAVLAMTLSTAKAIQFDELAFNTKPRMSEKAACTTGLLPARNVDGTIVPVVNLPVVTIEAEKTVPGRYAVTEKDGAFLATVDLPQVEVSAPYNCARLYPAVLSPEGYMASVTLPEVVISSHGPAADHEIRRGGP